MNNANRGSLCILVCGGRCFEDHELLVRTLDDLFWVTGFQRNQRMLDSEPRIDLVVAFPGGSGTADMVRRAKRTGIPVKEIT